MSSRLYCDLAALKVVHCYDATPDNDKSYFSFTSVLYFLHFLH